MSGYNAAVRWLKENGDEWKIKYADAALVAGPTVGAGTEERVSVALIPTQPLYDYGYDVELRGEGSTHLAAVQRAIGAYKA